MFKTMFVMFCYVTVAANGQQIAVTMSQSQQSSASGAARLGNPLSATLSVDMTNVTMKAALDEITSRSGIPVVYSHTVVPMNRKVSAHGTNITLGAALKQILKETGTEAKVTSEGQVTIGRVSRMQERREQGVIAGKVIDAKTGRGIAGANISVGTDNRGVVSADNGDYRITGISAGTHTVSARLVGYAKQVRSVTVGEGATVTVDFDLEASASVLDQVVVTGTVTQTELKAVPNAITIITAKQIEERGITRIDQLFRGDIPGLFSLNLGSNRALDEVVMFSRGATALPNNNTSVGTDVATEGITNPIKTYVDGVEMADSKYLSQIDPASIERIEILTGPQASTIYGSNAINGVMQIFTKRGAGSRPQFGINTNAGVAQNQFSNALAPSYLTNATVSGIEGRLSYSVGSSWNYVGAWTPGKQTQRFGYNGGGRMEMGKFTADVSARQGLTKNYSNGDPNPGEIDLRTTGLWSPSSSTGLSTPTTSTLNGRTMGLTIGYRPLSWWSHEIVLGSDVAKSESIRTSPAYGSGGKDTTVSIEMPSSSRSSQSYTTTAQLPVSSFAGLNLVFGADHWRTTASSVRAFPASVTGTFSSVQSVTRNKPGKNSGAFIQGQLSIRDALFFTYGVRSDWNPDFGEKAVVLPGRYGVSYTHDVGQLSIKARGSYGRSIRPPKAKLKDADPETEFRNALAITEFGQHDRLLANPDLGPESQQGGEGGIEFYLGNRGSLVVTRYNQTVNNLIYEVLGADSVKSLAPYSSGETTCSTSLDAGGYCYHYQSQYLNVGSLRNQGWELQGSVNAGPFTTRGTYSWTKSRIIGITSKYRTYLTGSSFEPGRPFNYVREHIWGLGFTYAHAASTISLYVNGTGMGYKGGDELSSIVALQSRFNMSRPRMGFDGGIYRSRDAGYAMADLNAAHRFSSHMDATLQISNVGNYYQNDYVAVAGAIGRQTRAGLRVRW